MLKNQYFIEYDKPKTILQKITSINVNGGSTLQRNAILTKMVEGV